jgi:hypothetical protein
MADSFKFNTSTIPVMPTDIFVKHTINAVKIEIDSYNLYTGASITARVYNTENKLMEIRKFNISGKEFANWASDDNYIVNYIINDFGYTLDIEHMKNNQPKIPETKSTVTKSPIIVSPVTTVKGASTAVPPTQLPQRNTPSAEQAYMLVTKDYIDYKIKRKTAVKAAKTQEQIDMEIEERKKKREKEAAAKKERAALKREKYEKRKAAQNGEPKPQKKKDEIEMVRRELNAAIRATKSAARKALGVAKVESREADYAKKIVDELTDKMVKAEEELITTKKDLISFENQLDNLRMELEQIIKKANTLNTAAQEASFNATTAELEGAANAEELRRYANDLRISADQAQSESDAVSEKLRVTTDASYTARVAYDNIKKFLERAPLDLKRAHQDFRNALTDVTIANENKERAMKLAKEAVDLTSAIIESDKNELYDGPTKKVEEDVPAEKQLA